MPRFDGTGPRGEGPKTGRGLGTCKTTSNEKIDSTPKPTVGYGRGMGRGAGRGIGKGNR